MSDLIKFIITLSRQLTYIRIESHMNNNRSIAWICCTALAIATSSIPTAYSMEETNRLTSVGIFSPDGELIRQWEIRSANPQPIQEWDGLDDNGEPVAPGSYEWKSISIPANALRSRWIMALGADPALNKDNEPVYFPGAIFGATALAASDDYLYIGTHTTDAADMLMQTSPDAGRHFWHVPQSVQHNSLIAMDVGGQDDQYLITLQPRNRVVIYDQEGTMLQLLTVPQFSQKPAPASVSANQAYIAISDSSTNLVRVYSLPAALQGRMERLHELVVPAPAALALIDHDHPRLVTVKADDGTLWISEPDTDSRPFAPGITKALALAYHDQQLWVATNPGHYHHQKNPQAHLNIEESSISKSGSLLFQLDPQTGTTLQQAGTGNNAVSGPWQPNNLNGVNSLAISGNWLIALDWPNRLVYFDKHTSEFVSERLMGDGSYFTMPVSIPGVNDRLIIRSMHNLYLWDISFDIDKRTWLPNQLIVNTAETIGASQSHYYRLAPWSGTNLTLIAGHVTRIQNNRTFPLLKTKKVDNTFKNIDVFTNPEAIPGKLTHEEQHNAVPHALHGDPAIHAISPDGKRLIDNHLMSSLIAETPATLSSAGTPIPDFSQSRILADMATFAPGRSFYQKTPGTFDADGNYYAVLYDRLGVHWLEGRRATYWPAWESADSWLFKVTPDGQFRFNVGKITAIREDIHGFTQPVLTDVIDDFVFVTARESPGQRIFTTDGLYIGNSWENNTPETVPTTLQDPYRRADIMRGAILRGDQGQWLHAQPNINRVDLYAIEGLDQARHQTGQVARPRMVSSSPQMGTGLNARFFSGVNFDHPIEQRLEPTPDRLKHDQERNFSHGVPAGIRISRQGVYGDHTWRPSPQAMRSATFSGWILVPKNATYTFDLELESPLDHAQLSIDGIVLIKAAGETRPHYVPSEPIRLRSGRAYPIELKYQPASVDKNRFSLNWQTPSESRRSVPASALYPTLPNIPSSKR